HLPISTFLPDGGAHETVTLALAGARDTGKSVCVGVTLKGLEQLVEAQGSTLTRIGATETNYEIEYQRPLYQARGMLRPTAAANSADAIQRYPLIFSLGRFQPGGKEIYLALRDVAGGGPLGTEGCSAPEVLLAGRSGAVLV
ncbi:hypothetical protein, partial [Propioniciclava flava]